MSDFMDEIERIAAEAARGRTARSDAVPDRLNVTVSIDDDDGYETKIPVVFVRDLDDTWTVHVGPKFSMAIRNPRQGAAISRLVELIATQRRTVVFDEDETERDHE